MTVYVDPDFRDEALRHSLYDGNLIVLTRLHAVSEFVDYTRGELTELFKPYDPEQAHEHFDPAVMAQMLSVWKPRFIHADESKRLVCEIIKGAGFPAEHTHYDVPKPRTSYPVGHLTTGVAFAFPWHRDTWYSAPGQQINWWLPIFPARPDNSMAFDLNNFDQPVPNTSGTFDYYLNNAQRLTTATGTTKEHQSRPGAVDHKPVNELVVLPPPGGVLLFSGNQLHTSIPNTSGRARYSIDFRTVDARDLIAGRGAPFVDVHCTGTAVRDFRNIDDGSSFREETVVELFGAPPPNAMLVYGEP